MDETKMDITIDGKTLQITRDEFVRYCMECTSGNYSDSTIKIKKFLKEDTGGL